ncbi:MAG: transketolase [Candidatus Doudnabacteria bacterium]|nr:transketolase [Candidatus Doudnabacteria bacterium]
MGGSEITETKINSLQKIANQIRQDIIKALVNAGSGHSAGPLGMADVFTVLYFHILNIRPKQPRWAERDRFVLSNGHINPVWYATLARRGFFPTGEFIKKLRKLGSRFPGHPHNLTTPGVENSGGPLGQGLSQAIGMALAAKLDKKKYQVYCVMSDGELQEGQNWEALMFAGARKLDNLTAIVDRNNIQIDGFTENVVPLEPLRAKLEAFNWHVIEIDGHNIRQIVEACRQAVAVYEKPVAILAHTIPGRGVDFMESDYHWHGVPPNKEQAREALAELRTLHGRIKSEHE